MDSRNRNMPTVNTIFIGEVASVQNYGAFISIPSSSCQGLVHRSQISSVNVPDVSEVLSKGDRVWCKVISINDDGKIALSMKMVDQGNGRDLDPNGVQMKLDEQKRKEWTPNSSRKTISLEAVFNTTCSKCGTRGHLSKDCFQVAGGKTYELLPEDETVVSKQHFGAESTTTDTQKQTEKEKKKAKKKEKKDKKLKKKMKKEAKKAAKEKKRKESSSSSSEGALSPPAFPPEEKYDRNRHKGKLPTEGKESRGTYLQNFNLTNKRSRSRFEDADSDGQESIPSHRKAHSSRSIHSPDKTGASRSRSPYKSDRVPRTSGSRSTQYTSSVHQETRSGSRSPSRKKKSHY